MPSFNLSFRENNKKMIYVKQSPPVMGRLLCCAYAQEEASELRKAVPICLLVLKVVFIHHLMWDAFLLVAILIQGDLNHCM